MGGGTCTLEKSRMAALYSIHLPPCHVTNAQNRKKQRGPLIKICGLQKTENARFSSSFVSLETYAPSIYQKAHWLSPLHCLYPDLIHPSPNFCSLSLSFFFWFVLGHVQITGASFRPQSCSCPGFVWNTLLALSPAPPQLYKHVMVSVQPEPIRGAFTDACCATRRRQV